MEINSDKRVYMLNSLWFKPNGGYDSYQKYMKAVGPILEKYGARPLPIFKPDKEVIGKFDADLLFFVEYPSWNVFKQMISDPEYIKIRRYREEAITKSLLIRCKRII